MEGFALTGNESTLIQNGRDLALSVVVEERVDLGDDLRRGLPKLP